MTPQAELALNCAVHLPLHLLLHIGPLNDVLIFESRFCKITSLPVL